MSAAFPGTLDELAALLDRAASAVDVFGLDIERACSRPRGCGRRMPGICMRSLTSCWCDCLGPRSITAW